MLQGKGSLLVSELCVWISQWNLCKTCEQLGIRAERVAEMHAAKWEGGLSSSRYV